LPTEKLIRELKDVKRENRGRREFRERRRVKREKGNSKMKGN